MKKRIVSIVLAICMVLVLVPTAAFAGEGDPVPVEKIVVTVDEPVIGREPDYTIDYTMETSEGSVQQGWTLQVTWCEISEDDVAYTNEDQWREMETGDKFRAGYIYYVGIAFANHENYPFTQETKATVNGNPNYDGFMDLYQEGGACVFGVFVPLKYVSSETELGDAINAGITRIMLTDDLTLSESLTVGGDQTKWQDLVIQQGVTLTIPQGVTLTIGQNGTLTIKKGATLLIQQGGTLTNNGVLETYSGGKTYVDGKVIGISKRMSAVYYLLNVENASASVEPAENLSEYDGKTYVSAESDSGESSTITLTPDNPPAGYWLGGWNVSSDRTVTVGTDNTFTMPNAAVTAAPRWEVIRYEPVSPKPIIENDGNATTRADLSNTTSTSGGTTTATIDQSTADQIVDNAVANQSEEVVIHATAKTEAAAASTTAAQVGIPTVALGAIAEKTEADVIVKTDIAEIKLDNTAAGAVAQQAAGDTVQLIVEKADETADKVEFELKVVCSDGNVIHDFKGGNVAVTVAVPKGLAGKKIVCVYVDENGKMSKVKGQKNADGTYTFFTGHFSTYAIMAEEEADTAIAAQKEETLAALADQRLTARSKIVAMKNGKKAVKITWYNESGELMDFDGVEIYRSTRRNAGYGKTPIFTTEKDAYYNTAIQRGTKYYYKVRGYVVIDGQKYYTDYSRKAIRTVK
ncbi:MAG: hypothetical protein ACI4WY_12100 [Anaerovoracaceae bacterium]